MLLILDLDDTIFETKSMDMAVFEPARQVIMDYALDQYGCAKAEAIIEEIKTTPFDLVTKKYDLPTKVIEKFYLVIQNIPYKLNIEVYDDYEALRNLDHPKYLVTTGITNLQQAKIDALQILPDFVKIFIDDPFDKDRIFKKGLFHQIVNETDPDRVLVIGDNPDSEIKAGKQLGLKTVQRLNGEKEKSSLSDYSIKTFNELDEIIRKATHNVT